MTIDRRWTGYLTAAGSAAMLVGAIDPLEGSVLILAGSALVAGAGRFGGGEPRLVGNRIRLFLLIIVGVVALWVLSALGGIGGPTGPSYWWSLLVLPYLAGWSLSIWAPDSPRWMLFAGMLVGAWYLVLAAMILVRPTSAGGAARIGLALVVAATGAVTIGGCLWRSGQRPVA